VSELLIGRIVEVAETAGARAPSFLVTVDLGPHGRHEVVLPTGSYSPADLEGAQVLCRRDADEVVVAGAHSHGKGLVLLRPDREVEDGTVVD
jgi:hypothetical protein